MRYPALPHAPRSYTVCDILQSKFHDIVLPGLGLSGADKDNERFKLECLIRDVLVTRNWVAHTTLSIEEMMRGLQSLVHLLHMLPCDAAQLKCVCDVVDACILEFVRCRSSERVFQLSLSSLARLVFKRHCQRFCDAVGEASEIEKAVKALVDQMAKKKVAVTPSIAMCKNIAVATRHEIYHGKCSGASLSVMVAMCALSSLFRTLAQVHAFPKVVEAAADACDADALQLLVRMQLCDEARLLKAVEDSHASMYVVLLPALYSLMLLIRLSACPYAALLPDSASRTRHLLWRMLPLHFPSLCSIDIHDKSCHRRVMSMLNVVKFVPNAASASESDAVSWLLSKPSQLAVLARAANYSLPAKPSEADVAL
jgi:hypothetical protein